MSELKPIYEDFFTGRKPSRAQVMARVKTAIKAGAEAITMQWGEHSIDLDYHLGQWKGSGHIKEISAWDIAIELNEAAREHRRILALWNT